MVLNNSITLQWGRTKEQSIGGVNAFEWLITPPIAIQSLLCCYASHYTGGEYWSYVTSLCYDHEDGRIRLICWNDYSRTSPSNSFAYLIISI